MKTYEEMAQSVIHRAKAHKTARNRWIAGSVAAVLALGLCMGVMMTDRPTEEPTLQTPPVTVEPSQTIVSVGPAGDSILQTLPSAEAGKHRVTFLYAEGENATEMEQGVTLPSRSQLRIVDVSGMTDAERRTVALEEQEFAETLLADYPEVRGRGWMQYSSESSDGTPSVYNDHLVATFIHAGRFILSVPDWSQVESVAASTKNSVLILPGFPRVEEVDPLAYPQSRQYYMNKEEVNERCENGIEADIGLGSGVVWYLNEHSIPLSQLSETFTFTFNFTDGTQEAYTIDMIFNDNGEIYTLYRGATAVA